MAEREIKKWITVNGKHIPIYDDKAKGLGAEWLDWSGVYGEGTFDIHADEKEKRLEFTQLLKDAGAFPEDTKEAEEYLRHYLEYDIYEDGDHSLLLEGLAKWNHGGSRRGYQENKKGFDEKYGISKFIDKHSELQLNTDIPMYRGVRTSQSEIDMLQMAMQGKSPITMRGISSWTAADNIADRFTKSTLAPSGDIRLMYKDITKGKRKALPYPYSGQHEAIYSKSAQFEIVSMDYNGYRWLVEVRRK